MSALVRAHVAAGNFFFRWRNSLFPLMFTFLAVLAYPASLTGSPAGDRALIRGGALLALVGQAIRLITIGHQYIERGGKRGKVFASSLVVGGVYAHVRNPMYVGNLLMVAGLLLYSGAPVAIGIGLPFFLYVYLAIISAEEGYLAAKFGADYQRYCHEVPSLVPRLSGWRETFAGSTFDWRRALRKDYGTVYALALGLLFLPVWRTWFLEGSAAARSLLPAVLRGAAAATVGWAVTRWLKFRKRLG